MQLRRLKEKQNHLKAIFLKIMITDVHETFD